MQPFRAPPPLTTLPPGYPTGRPEHPGMYLLLLWTVFITVILIIYTVLSLVLHLDERNHARRQQQLLEEWRRAFPPSPPPPRPEEERDIERSPLLHSVSDGDTAEDEGSYPHGGGYGATDAHPPFVPAQVRDHRDPGECRGYGPAADPTPSPPYSPGTPNNSYMNSIDAVAEPAEDHDGHVMDAAKPRSPSTSEVMDPSVVTDSGVAWEHVESVAGHGSGLAEEAAAAAEDAVAAEAANGSSAGRGPSQIFDEVAASASSPPESPGIMGGHEVMTKIKKAVHWPDGLKGGSSSSSSGCSSPWSAQQDGQADGLRKRGPQE